MQLCVQPMQSCESSDHDSDNTCLLVSRLVKCLVSIVSMSLKSCHLSIDAARCSELHYACVHRVADQLEAGTGDAEASSQRPGLLLLIPLTLGIGKVRSGKLAWDVLKMPAGTIMSMPPTVKALACPGHPAPSTSASAISPAEIL